MAILVTGDDRALAGFLARGLNAEGLNCVVAQDVAETIQSITTGVVDLLIADCSVSELLVRQARERRQQLPIIALTSRGTPEDRVAVLEAGADDCLMKPFSFVELLARVKAVFRRMQAAPQHEIRYKDLELNRVTRTVRREGKLIELTTKEFALLKYLLLNSGRAVSRSMILEDVWRIHFDTMTNVVDVYINYFEELNMKEIGQVLGVVESRVSQIRSAAILKLRAILGNTHQATSRTRVNGRTATACQ